MRLGTILIVLISPSATDLRCQASSGAPADPLSPSREMLGEEVLPQQQPRPEGLQVTLNDRIKGASSRNTPAVTAAKKGGSWLDAFRKSSMLKRGGGGAGKHIHHQAQQGDRGPGDGGGQAAQGKHGPVLYKFHEGYTNAVKRVLRMSDLLAQQ